VDGLLSVVLLAEGGPGGARWTAQNRCSDCV